ncbi:MAG: hypothetical protein MR820_05965 [Prevotella sp.]|nr:hypothetical protein [Prevotella sp.]
MSDESSIQYEGCDTRFFCCLVVLLFCDFVVWLIAIIAKKQHPKSNEPKSNEPKSNEPKSNEPKSNEPTSNEPKSNKICLEDSTERSESNPGRILGITNMKKATVWMTVPNS